MMAVKSKKPIIIAILMPIFALGLWYADAYYEENLFELQLLLPSSMIILGSLVSIRAMKDSLSDVLAVESLFFALFLITRGIVGIINDDSDLGPIVGCIQFLVGAPLFLLSLNLWIKVEFSANMIRYICSIILLVCVAKVFLFVHEPESMMFSETMSSILMGGMNVCLIVLSMDKKVASLTLGQISMRSVEGIEMKMASVSDAYILSSGANDIMNLLGPDSPTKASMKLYSNQYGDRPIVFERTADGKVRVEIYSHKHSMSNPYFVVTAKDVVVAQDHVSVYAEDGSWFRFLVYENVQPNCDKALILGHEIDVRKYFESYMLRRLYKKNLQKEAPMPEESFYGEAPPQGFQPQYGMPSMEQELWFPDGGHYRGMLDERGLFAGPGVYTYPNGDRFEGSHIAGVRNGPGCYIWADGSWTRGNYVNGVRDGPTAVYTARDGLIYEGNMSNERFVGSIRISCNGRPVYEGGCDDMRPCGNGILYVDGGRIIGQWNPDGTCNGTFRGQDGSTMPTDPTIRYF